MSDKCTCVTCCTCKGTTRIFTGHLDYDQDYEYETCDMCDGTGVVELCNYCTYMIEIEDFNDD